MITAPGFEPQPGPVIPMRVIGVVDDITLEQAQQALPKAKELFTANARGVLVDEVHCETFDLSRKLNRQAFELFYDRIDGSFSCIVRRPGREEECFYSGGQAVIYRLIDSVLGETTLEGILRVLDIPRHMLSPAVGAPPRTTHDPQKALT